MDNILVRAFIEIVVMSEIVNFILEGLLLNSICFCMTCLLKYKFLYAKMTEKNLVNITNKLYGMLLQQTFVLL